MTILVDDIQYYAYTPLKFKHWCHMGTDDHTEKGLKDLHTMAKKIGLQRLWFQDKPQFPHYDLTESRRTLAIIEGAIEVDAFEWVKRCKRLTEKK